MTKKILILGASGMLGNTFLRYFSQMNEFKITATVRSYDSIKTMTNLNKYNLLSDVDFEDINYLSKIFDLEKPDIVINCAGLIKHSKEAKDYLKMIYINSLFPHYLANLSLKYNFRLIHFSTDCVFLGTKGNYTENDYPDAVDWYGRSKLIGEINSLNAITLRTSYIGHELNSSLQLVDWFLCQTKTVKGYKKAIFSGLTTLEIAKILHKYVLVNTHLRGLYHLSGYPISKYELLLLVKNIYNKNIEIFSDEKMIINRSLDSSRFCKATNFVPKTWPLMVKEMYEFSQYHHEIF